MNMLTMIETTETASAETDNQKLRQCCSVAETNLQKMTDNNRLPIHQFPVKLLVNLGWGSVGQDNQIILKLPSGCQLDFVSGKNPLQINSLVLPGQLFPIVNFRDTHKEPNEKSSPAATERGVERKEEP